MGDFGKGGYPSSSFHIVKVLPFRFFRNFFFAILGGWDISASSYNICVQAGNRAFSLENGMKWDETGCFFVAVSSLLLNIIAAWRGYV
jgi:hypothetical protein